MLHNIKIVSGQWVTVAKQGTFINVVLASGEITARIQDISGETFETKLLSGMSFKNRKEFVSISLTADVSQQSRLWLSDLPLTYSPLDAKLVGSSGLSNSVEKAFYGLPSQLAPAKSGRNKLTIFAPEDLFVGGVDVTSASAIKIIAGQSRDFSTQGAVYGYTDNPQNKSRAIAKPPIIGIDLPLITSKAAYHGGQPHYSAANNYLYIGYVSGYDVVDAETLALVKSVNNTRGLKTADASNSAARYWVENGSDLYTIATRTSETILIKIDTLTDVKTEVVLISDGCEEIQDYFIDFATEQVAMIGKSGSVYKLFTGDLNSISLRTVPNMGVYGLMSVVCVSGKLYLYSYDNQVISDDNGAVWGAVSGLPFATSYWGGVKIDEITGKFYGHSQRDIYTSIDGVNWNHTHSHAENRSKYGNFIAGGYYFSVGERYLITSSDNGLTFNEQNLTGLGVSDASSVCISPSSNGLIYISNDISGLHVFGGEAVNVGGLDVAIMEETN